MKVGWALTWSCSRASPSATGPLSGQAAWLRRTSRRMRLPSVCRHAWCATGHRRIMDNAPLITFMIATRNRVDELQKTLAACLAQNWPAVEILVVDDASSDGTF